MARKRSRSIVLTARDMDTLASTARNTSGEQPQQPQGGSSGEGWTKGMSRSYNHGLSDGSEGRPFDDSHSIHAPSYRRGYTDGSRLLHD